ncbi:DMT family transporter [Candidatus Sumerlaeota bacterium]|nr:DMT family transporter [Candidatus Sumerlaeota bacterium]
MGATSGPLAPSRRLRAEAALLFTTFLWATTSVTGRWLVGESYSVHLSEWLILAVRFTIASALVLAWYPSSCRVRGHGGEWRISAWLGLLLGATFLTQLFGQRTIEATRSHFLTNLSVIIVPMMQVLILRRRPGRGALIGVALAMAGLVLLTDPLRGRVVAGDGWTLVAAFAYSAYIIELQRLGGRVELPRLLLGQFALIGLVCWAMALSTGSLRALPEVTPSIWLLLLYLGVLCTFGATWLHNRFQRDTTPTRTALIFVSGPVMTFLLAWALLGETLGLGQLLGAGLILGAILVTELL